MFSVWQWLCFILIIQLVHGLGTWKLYIKAGRKSWEAYVPVYNGIIWMQIIKRPWYWLFLCFLPIINLIMIPSIWVESIRSFGKSSKGHAILVILTLGLYLYYINYIEEVNYFPDREKKSKSTLGDFLTSALYAIVFASVIHIYFFQPFVIPSSSLEKSLLVGDFLIVSKVHYGSRLPMTTMSLPMVHDTIPILNKKSYLFSDKFEERKTSWKNWFQLPYLRLPALQKIKRNDIVVFNQPADTLRDFNHFTPDRNYYKPIDKKTNLVKRCVAIPGDTLEIKNGYVYIDGKKNELPDRAKLQFSYYIKLKRALSKQNLKHILKKCDITDRFGALDNSFTNWHLSAASDEAISKLKLQPDIESVLPSKKQKGVYNDAFPRDALYPWNTDYFGPIVIPAKGQTIEINHENLSLYKRAIMEYEDNHVFSKGQKVFLNGKPISSYTFKQDYYWMMGDNRHNSIDARYWGLVPFDHVMGKPVFIWMSVDNFNEGISNWKIRWDRVFTTVGGKGDRVSYLIPFLVLLVIYFGYNKWRKKKKASL